MFILLCSLHSLLLIELLTTSLILISFFFILCFFSRITINYCIVMHKKLLLKMHIIRRQVCQLLLSLIVASPLPKGSDNSLDQNCGLQEALLLFLCFQLLLFCFSVWQKYEIPQYFTCIEFSPNGDVITGDSNGSITVWGKGTRQSYFAITVLVKPGQSYLSRF